MENFYIVILVFLACLAAFDLFVGVSNDAVNFLNAAIGSRITTFRTIMIVAAAGVMLGATFSSGMMEIARSGIFNPQMFTFHQIMIIFFAVMVADIILLDTFNSLGLPTSTTVSIVFELLGSALAAAVMKLYMDGASFTQIVNYINGSKSLSIISGILISVVVAFIVGSIVQYIMRLVFSFHIENAYRRFGAIFGSICLTAIFYFLVMKGAKGASFMRPEWLAYIKNHTGIIVLVLFIGFAIMFQCMISFFKANIFKTIILAGTFSLAFAFAGNDLVNFVGVPLAAYDSWRDWSMSAVASNEYLMGGLLKPAQAPTVFLLLSGLIMVLTLWFSRKARRVIETSIKLSSSQSDQEEQFSSSVPARLIVRGSMAVGNIVHAVIPNVLQRKIDSRFVPKELEKGEVPLPFDHVRASVNLMVSAILIACATSLKLPLSTTYVTFMVAMGSSFADGAWDRETAVYRISGVLAVISGWFMTAISACILAAIVASLVFIFGEYMAIALGILAIGLIVRSNFRKDKSDMSLKQALSSRFNAQDVKAMLKEQINENYDRILDIYSNNVESFLGDHEGDLRKNKATAIKFLADVKNKRKLYFTMALSDFKANKNDLRARFCYYRICTNMREIVTNLQGLTARANEYVANRHSVYKEPMKDSLREAAKIIRELDVDQPLHDFIDQYHELERRIDTLQSRFLQTVPQEKISLRGSEVYLHFFFFCRDLLNRFNIVAHLYDRVCYLEKNIAEDDDVLITDTVAHADLKNSPASGVHAKGHQPA